MKVANVVKVLRNTAIFGTVHDEALNVLAFNGVQSTFSAGDRILKKGEKTGSAMVVLSGEIEVHPPRKSSPVIGGPATMVGELSLLAGRPATTDVRAHKKCEVLQVDRELFGRVAGEFPDIATKLHQQLLARMQSMINDLSGLEALLRLEPVSPSSRQIPQSQEHGRRASPNPGSRQRP